MLSYPLDLRQKFARGRVLYEIPCTVLRLYPTLQHLVFGAQQRRVPVILNPPSRRAGRDSEGCARGASAGAKVCGAVCSALRHKALRS